MSSGMSAFTTTSHVEGEAELLVEALRRYGLLRSDEALDASWISSDRQFATLGTQAVSFAELPTAHQCAYNSASHARVVLGVRTNAVEAVSVKGFRCLAQSSAYFHGTVAVAASVADAAKALEHTPRAVCLALPAAVYVLGQTTGAAFVLAFYLNQMCRLQLLIGSRLAIEPSAEVMSHANVQILDLDAFAPGVEWPAVVTGIRGESVPISSSLEASNEEWAIRKALSDAHKLLNKRGLDELIWNHLSAKCADKLLLTAGDVLWNLMEPETLLSNSNNETANILHSAIYAADPSIRAVVHTHSTAIEATSCLTEGMIEPKGSMFIDKVAYYDWEGVSDDWDECKRVSRAIQKVPGCVALIMRNHGGITWGCSVEEALERHLQLDAACRETLFATNETSFALDELRAEISWLEHRPWALTSKL